MAIKRTLGLEIGAQERGASFTLKAGEHDVTVTFLDAPDNAFLGAQNQAVAFQLDAKSRAVVYIEDHKAVLMISREDPTPGVFSLQMEGLQDIESEAQSGTGLAGINTLYWTLVDGKMISAHDGIFTFAAQSVDMRWEFSLEDIRMRFSAMSGFATPTIPAGYRGPEFSLGVFDGYNSSTHVFLRPRPLRLGVPVISTVPVYDSALAEDDLEYYNNGLGPSARTMHFRVVCNQTLPTGTPVHLLISVPDGLDTVAAPVAVLMSLIDSGNNIYYANYTFNVEDTVLFVDGFAYLSVHIPLIQQIALPMMIQLDNTSAESFAAPSEDVTLFSANQDDVQVSSEKEE